MYRLALSVVAALGLALSPALATQIPADITAAVNDAGRPDKDKARDADRKPAEIMALTGIKSGDTVVDVGPGAGYYSRIMSRIVGTSGRIYGFNPSWVAEKFPTAIDGVKALTAGGYPNVVNSVQPMAEIKFDQPVDMIFMSQLYHDQIWQKVDIAQMNKAIFSALKPGGVFFIIDHVGNGVTTVEQIDKLHRIDPALVKEQVLAAGFKLAAESDLLRNAGDTGEKNVFDPSLRGRTDQFVYKFVKPN